MLLQQCISYAAYLGVNNKRVEQLNSNLNGDPTYEYNVDWGVVHPQYLACDRDSQDIGLIRLAREAELDNFRIQPICLPLQFDPKFDTVEGEEEMVVYTSGWGRWCQATLAAHSLSCQALHRLRHGRVWSSQRS